LAQVLNITCTAFPRRHDIMIPYGDDVEFNDDTENPPPSLGKTCCGICGASCLSLLFCVVAVVATVGLPVAFRPSGGELAHPAARPVSEVLHGSFVGASGATGSNSSNGTVPSSGVNASGSGPDGAADEGGASAGSSPGSSNSTGSGSGGNSSNGSSSNSSNRSRRAMHDAWSAYVEEAHNGTPGGLSSRCQPRVYLAGGPAAAVPYRGAVVLLHGLAACPEQWELLAPMVAARGYDVLVPVLPGSGIDVTASHPAPVKVWVGYFGVAAAVVLWGLAAGCFCCPKHSCCGGHYVAVQAVFVVGSAVFVISVIAWAFLFQEGAYCLFGCSGAVDDSTNLPSDPGAYSSFTDRINSVVALAPGERAIAGLDLGGAIAARAGQEVDAGGVPLYHRQLLVRPLFGLWSLVDPLVSFIAMVGHGESYFGFGDECQYEREAGRGGLCTFQMRNLAAARDFGAQTLKGLTAARGTEVAVLLAKGDTVVSNNLGREAAEKLSAQGAGAGSCVTGSPPGHSGGLVAPRAQLGADRRWVPGVLCNVAGYLADGQPLPLEDGTDESEGGQRICRIGEVQHPVIGPEAVKEALGSYNCSA